VTFRVIVDRQNRFPSMSIHWKEQKLTKKDNESVRCEFINDMTKMRRDR